MNTEENKVEFESEKEMGNYLEKRIELFTERVLDRKLGSYVREYPLTKQRFGQRSPRIDFLIRADNKKIGIEIKNQNNLNEILRGITQLLYYSSIEKMDEMYLLTSYYKNYIIEFIKKYNLPTR